MAATKDDAFISANLSAFFSPSDVESVHPELRDLHLQARVRVGDLKTEKVRLCDMRGLTTHLAL